MQYKNIKQTHRIYFYLYIIEYIQLTQATHPTIPTEAFAYDAVGNRNNTSVDAANKLLQDPNATYQYDNNGNRYIKTQSDGSVVYYSYDYEGRLTRVETQKPGLTTVAVYKYDPLGRRIEKNVDGVVTKYLYSNEGLIAEYDANGILKKSYGWMPNGIWGTDPLYMTENSQTYFYHNDAIGTPQKMTDAGGNVVWSANYTAFGKATIDPSSTITNNLRFAGQYFDSETGVNYNLNRVYDPSTGKYMTKDPIGFAGDVNLYRYVGNNPVNWMDPWGLVALLADKIAKLVAENNLSGQGNELIICVIRKESGFDPDAKNPSSSATGLMQVTKAAAKDAGYEHSKMTDPATNIQAGSKYLKLRIQWANGNVTNGLNGYGTGNGYANSILECEKCLKGKTCDNKKCLK